MPASTPAVAQGTATAPASNVPPAPTPAPHRAGPAPTQRITVVNTLPHHPDAFTQGLEFSGAELYESTGLVGHSSVRRLDPSTGRVQDQVTVAPPHFAEGLSVMNGRIYQITWQSGECFVYTLPGMTPTTSLHYTGEGWGLTNDGRALIMSDGSDVIRFRDPATFAVTREIHVNDDGRPVDQLNELEYIEGEIWSNVWHDDRIARIDPANGRINAWIDLSSLTRTERTDPEAVANGIAYEHATHRVLVTGKLWGHMYEIRVTDGG